MSKLTCSLVLLALLGLGMVPSLANADGRIVVYFDQAGTERSADPGPAGTLVSMSVYGEGFEDNATFVSGAQFQVDYSPNIMWIGDYNLFAAVIGNTRDGYSVGFGYNPQFGSKFEIVRANGLWLADDCSGGINVNGPVTLKHSGFPEPTPIISRFPDQAIFSAGGARSQTCQLVEMDINPGSCPNPYNVKLLDWLIGDKINPSVLPVAILGSETVDVTDIDPTTLLLEGVAALRWSYEDVATLDGHDGCECNDEDGDGYMDMTVKFPRQPVGLALALADPEVGQWIPLTLTGAYLGDGLDFAATDCIMLVGNPGSKREMAMAGVSGLGFPNPNPFNPVTRISYSVPSTQHVRIAIFDVAGRLVEDLVNESKGAGEYVVEWDAGRLPSGVYFYRMQAGDQTIVRRATLLK